jgi:hypothetical protein
MNTVLRTIGGVVGGQMGAAILESDTIGRSAIPAESAFVTAFWISVVAAVLAVGLALLVSPRRVPRTATA